VPEPEGSNGTNPGITTEGYHLNSAYSMASSYLDQLINIAKNLLTIFWTGPWPLLHFVIATQIINDVYLEIDLAWDLLSIVSLYAFNFKFLNIQNMNENDGDRLVENLTPVNEGLIGTGNSWSYLFGVATITWVALEFAARYANPTSFYQEVAIWALLTISVCLIEAGLILLAEAITKITTDPLLGAITFIGIALVALNRIDANREAINNPGTSNAKGTMKVLRFFENRYLQNGDRNKIGLKGRTHVGIIIAEIIVLVTVILLAIGFISGEVYNVFT
jgi:hypothetical protein